jgi:hypothetical protein
VDLVASGGGLPPYSKQHLTKMKEFFGTVDEILGHRHVDRSAAQSANQGGSSGQGYREGGSV